VLQLFKLILNFECTRKIFCIRDPYDRTVKVNACLKSLKFSALNREFYNSLSSFWIFWCIPRIFCIWDPNVRIVKGDTYLKIPDFPASNGKCLLSLNLFWICDCIPTGLNVIFARTPPGREKMGHVGLVQKSKHSKWNNAKVKHCENDVFSTRIRQIENLQIVKNVHAGHDEVCQSKLTCVGVPPSFSARCQLHYVLYTQGLGPGYESNPEIRWNWWRHIWKDMKCLCHTYEWVTVIFFDNGIVNCYMQTPIRTLLRIWLTIPCTGLINSCKMYKKSDQPESETNETGSKAMTTIMVLH